MNAPFSSKFAATHENCPVCGVRYEREPSFFTGAMYISYAISVGIFLTSGLLVYLIDHNASALAYILTTIFFTLILIPLNFRYSRVLLLYLISGIKYAPELDNAKNTKTVKL
jgi:uncharacterized protein (DUF983 family)